MASPAIALGVLTVDARLPHRFSSLERVSSRVLLALDALGGPVAVKLAAGADAADARALAREFERLASLSHPAFPRAGAFGFLADGRAYLSMERATGEVPAGPMDWADLARLADGLCEALAVLHARSWLHRALRLDHVRYEPRSGRVMLLDLGQVGAPAPIAAGPAASRGADVRPDLHQLGLVLHELATGRPPRRAGAAPADGDGLLASRPDAPPAFARLVAGLLAPQSADCPASAAQCRQRLADALGVEAGPAAGQPPLVGRERELDALLEQADRARRAPVVTTLAGPAGSGRTALLEAFRCRLMLEGVPVLRRSALVGLSLRALAREVALLVDAPVGAVPGTPEEEVAAALRGSHAAIEANPSLRGPVTLLVDEAGEASPETKAELAKLAHALPAGVLLVVVDGPRGESLGPSSARVDLGPLPASAVRTLLRAARRGAVTDEQVGRAMATTRQPAAILASLEKADAEVAARGCADAEDPEQLLKAGRVAAAVAAWQARIVAMPAGFEGERASCLARQGLALWVLAEPADALARAESALALAVQCGDASAEAEAARVLGLIYGAFGSTRDGVGWQRRALEVAARDGGVPRHPALSEIGLLMVREGHVEAALRALTEAVRDADERHDAAGSARARVRLGRARLVAGDLGGADKLLRRALAESRACGDALIALEAERMLGIAATTCGSLDEAASLLEGALERSHEHGALQEMPALHEALAQVHLQRAIRLRTSTGAIVDRSRLEVARAHVEKGLDLALATGRMADRAALAALAARCALLSSDSRGALRGAEEAHALALEAGDLLVASQARLVKSEALLDLREFGEALAEARIACEAFDRSGDLEDAWRGHALLARIHGAWGMSSRQASETEIAARILRKLEASLRDPRARRAYVTDVDRSAALAPPVACDGRKARRGAVPELAGARFAGRADTEDLVEALIASRQRNAELERRARAGRSVARDARIRRDALLWASTLASRGGSPRSTDVERVLSLLSRACAGGHVVLATSNSGRLRVRGASGTRSGSDPAAHEASLVVARRVVETGRGSLALGALGTRKSDPDSGDVHVAIPLESAGGVFGALVVRAAEGRSLRRADIRLLRATAPLLALAVASGERDDAPDAGNEIIEACASSPSSSIPRGPRTSEPPRER